MPVASRMIRGLSVSSLQKRARLARSTRAQVAAVARLSPTCRARRRRLNKTDSRVIVAPLFFSYLSIDWHTVCFTPHSVITSQLFSFPQCSLEMDCSEEVQPLSDEASTPMELKKGMSIFLDVSHALLHVCQNIDKRREIRAFTLTHLSTIPAYLPIYVYCQCMRKGRGYDVLSV